MASRISIAVAGANASKPTPCAAVSAVAPGENQCPMMSSNRRMLTKPLNDLSCAKSPLKNAFRTACHSFPPDAACKRGKSSCSSSCLFHSKPKKPRMLVSRTSGIALTNVSYALHSFSRHASAAKSFSATCCCWIATKVSKHAVMVVLGSFPLGNARPTKFGPGTLPAPTPGFCFPAQPTVLFPVVDLASHNP